jgi:hypothetical protein
MRELGLVSEEKRWWPACPIEEWPSGSLRTGGCSSQACSVAHSSWGRCRGGEQETASCTCLGEQKHLRSSCCCSLSAQHFC